MAIQTSAPQVPPPVPTRPTIPRSSKPRRAPGIRPNKDERPQLQALKPMFSKHFNSDNKFCKLFLLDNTKERICYTCKTIFFTPKVLSELIYKKNYTHQAYYCGNCSTMIVDSYISGAVALKNNILPDSSKSKKFERMDIWELIDSFKKIPSFTLLPYMFHEIHKLFDSNGKLTRADQQRIMTSPVKVQQAILKIVPAAAFDTDLRNKMLLKALRAFGKRPRSKETGITEIPMEVIRKLRTKTLIRVLVSASTFNPVPDPAITEISAMLFPVILKDGKDAENAKHLLDNMRKNANSAVKLSPNLITV